MDGHGARCLRSRAEREGEEQGRANGRQREDADSVSTVVRPRGDEWWNEWSMAAMRRACSVLPVPVALNGETEERDKMEPERIFMWWVKYVDSMRPRSVRRLDAGQTPAMEHYRS